MVFIFLIQNSMFNTRQIADLLNDISKYTLQDHNMFSGGNVWTALIAASINNLADVISTKNYDERRFQELESINEELTNKIEDLNKKIESLVIKQ